MTTCREFLEILAPMITDELVVTSIGRVNIEWRRLTEPRESNLCGVYMGGGAAIGLGMALSLPHRRVIVIDGDGSILMALTILLAIGHKKPPNLVVIVGDNEAYEQTRSVPTFTATGTDLGAIARGAGIERVSKVSTVEEFRKAINSAYANPGPAFIWMKMDGEDIVGEGLLISMDQVENKYRFVRHVEQTEGVEVLKPTGMAMPTALWPLARH
jgi:sulfopyruvate decarboxylase subunit beta